MPDKATPPVLAGVPVRTRAATRERRSGYVVTTTGYGFVPGTLLTDAEAEAAESAGTLAKFTVPVKG